MKLRRAAIILTACLLILPAMPAAADAAGYAESAYEEPEYSDFEGFSGAEDSDTDAFEENNDGDDTYVSNNGTVFRIPRVEDPSLHVFDFAGCLTEDQQEALRERIAKIGERLDADIVILISEDVPEDVNYGTETTMRYCRQFYLDNGYRDDGFCFLIDLNNRVMWTAGHGRFATEKYADMASDIYESALSAGKRGDYYEVAQVFLNYMNKVENRAAAAVPTLPSLIGSAILTLIGMLGFILFHKGTQPSKNTTPAVTVDAFNRRAHQEHYLGTTVTRTPIPKKTGGSSGGHSGGVSSGGFSSGGGKFSGGGGKF